MLIERYYLPFFDCISIYHLQFVVKMSPPTYSDLGKQARDVFGKGYHFGVLKLECKSKSDVGVEITAGGTNILETGKVNANVETKYKFKEQGKFIIVILYVSYYYGHLVSLLAKLMLPPKEFAC